MISWILQKNITSKDTLDKIKSALIEDHISFQEVNIIPFSLDFPSIDYDYRTLIVYGSTTMMINAFNNPKLRRGVFFDPNQFNMENYVDKWGENMLNFDGKLIRFKKVNQISDKSKAFFIRPNSDQKEFGGKILSGLELIEWYNKIEALNIEQLNPETKIWIANPKKILKEWRIFIIDKNIISISKYIDNNELNIDNKDIPNSLIDFIKKRISEYQPHDIFVLDVALIESGYKIIECNCFNGTGFYDHDINKIIKTINKKMGGLST